MKVSIIMGSGSDWDVMSAACGTLDDFGVPYEKKVISAHRTPEFFREYMASARQRGVGVVIAGAGGAAHLPGMAAAMTTLPVIGVPIRTSALGGLDSLLSIVQTRGHDGDQRGEERGALRGVYAGALGRDARGEAGGVQKETGGQGSRN